MPVDFNKLIEKHLRRDSRPKSVGRYYPSEAGSCLRKSWYSFRFPQPVSAKSTKHFLLGNMLHDFMAEVLENPANTEIKLLQKEIPVKIAHKDFTVSGRMDDVFMLTADGRKFILEVKSTGSKLDWMKGPQDSHVMQLQLYMHAQDVKEGIILYLEKSTLEGKWFRVDYDPAIAESVLKRFETLDGCLKSDTLPAAEARERPDWSWLCKDCEYFSMCAGDAKTKGTP